MRVGICHRVRVTNTPTLTTTASVASAMSVQRQVAPLSITRRPAHSAPDTRSQNQSERRSGFPLRTSTTTRTSTTARTAASATALSVSALQSEPSPTQRVSPSATRRAMADTTLHSVAFRIFGTKCLLKCASESPRSG